MRNRPFTLAIHIALTIILVGAIITHFFGIQGEVVLPEGGSPTREFVKTSGPGDGRFPFEISLVKADIEFYPGTTTPMDFRSELKIGDEEIEVSMNNVADVDGWRFFQSGLTPESSRLTVSYDPWGTGVTYFGYAMLGIGMIGYFFQRSTPWRALLRGLRTSVALAAVVLPMSVDAATLTDELPAMQRPLAANFGKIYVYWNDRVCPMQTMARDVTAKLYGSDSYRGLTAEQVLSGWLFYFEKWERDFNESNPATPECGKAEKRANECRALINWLGTGDAFKIFPYITVDGHTEWLSLTGRRPSGMELEQWIFMQKAMPDIKENLLAGRNVRANELISALIANQQLYAGDGNLPSPQKIEAERLYNGYVRLLPPAIVALVLGFSCLYVAVGGRTVRRRLRVVGRIGFYALLLYLVGSVGLLWVISGHIPLSNGPEMMMFMSLIAVVCALVSRQRMLKGAFLIVAAMTLFVGVMGGRTPRIGMLMPVLSSPLLSVHVMLVMTAYVLFLIMSILAIVGLSAKDESTTLGLARLNRVILVPAVFLLAAGIFVGAVWANQSWGRYWGWDPKETCALVMLLIYSLPVHHSGRLARRFSRPRVLHWYLLIAVLSVLFTYFGANYFLSGLHSYA